MDIKKVKAKIEHWNKAYNNAKWQSAAMTTYKLKNILGMEVKVVTKNESQAYHFSKDLKEDVFKLDYIETMNEVLSGSTDPELANLELTLNELCEFCIDSDMVSVKFFGDKNDGTIQAVTSDIISE